MQKKYTQSKVATTVFKLSLLLAGTFASGQATYAYWHPSINTDAFHTARPYLSISEGLTLNIKSGDDQFIPIVNPDQDQYFRYRVDSDLRTANYFQVGGGAEMQLNDKWSWQLGASYNYSTTTVGGKLTQGPEPGLESTFKYRYGVTSNQFLLENKFLYHNNSLLHPYFLIGLGESTNRFEDFTNNIPAGLTFTQQYANHKTHAFSYALGLGVDANITKVVRLGLGYRFTDLGKVESGAPVIDDLPGNGTLKQSHFYINEVFAQITYLLM